MNKAILQEESDIDDSSRAGIREEQGTCFAPDLFLIGREREISDRSIKTFELKTRGQLC